MKECYWCEAAFIKPREVLKYDNHLFCDEKCLGAYLVEREEFEIETEWIDTPENMEICAKEDAAEW